MLIEVIGADFIHERFGVREEELDLDTIFSSSCQKKLKMDRD